MISFITPDGRSVKGYASDKFLSGGSLIDLEYRNGRGTNYLTVVPISPRNYRRVNKTRAKAIITNNKLSLFDDYGEEYKVYFDLDNVPQKYIDILIAEELLDSGPCFGHIREDGKDERFSDKTQTGCRDD